MEILQKIDTLRDLAGESMQEVTTSGLSGASYYQSKDLFMKICTISGNPLGQRTHDQGREFFALSSPHLKPLWEQFYMPYLAIALEKNTYGLLMKNLGTAFDGEKNFETMHPRYIKDLAQLHGLFWADKTLASQGYLLRLQDYYRMLGPQGKASDQDSYITQLMAKGWEKVRHLIDNDHYQLLMNPEELAFYYQHLPVTFVHGDYRPTNIAYHKDHDQLCLIDFAFSGFAPCSVDLFWYIATTTWLGSDYEETIATYKEHLEEKIGPLDPDLWQDLVEAGIISACCMQLWEKALDYEKNPKDFDAWYKRLCSTKPFQKSCLT